MICESDFSYYLNQIELASDIGYERTLVEHHLHLHQLRSLHAGIISESGNKDPNLSCRGKDKKKNTDQLYHYEVEIWFGRMALFSRRILTQLPKQESR